MFLIILDILAGDGKLRWHFSRTEARTQHAAVVACSFPSSVFFLLLFVVCTQVVLQFLLLAVAGDGKQQRGGGGGGGGEDDGFGCCIDATTQ